MPRQQSLPTWMAWNAADFPTASGLTDTRTGQAIQAGGLDVGDFFEATEREANDCSNLKTGLLHHGQYRLVQVDSAATPANVKTGTIGYLRIGTYVSGLAIVAAGTGYTPGTYVINIPAGTGGGSGAALQVVIGANGQVASATLLSGGTNYTSVPTIPLTALPAGSGANIVAQLNSTPRVVTSYDQANTMLTKFFPVVFLNPITPGNFGFVQEHGLATMLGSAAGGAAGDFVNVAAPGTVSGGGATFTNATVGIAADAPQAGLFKAYIARLVQAQD